MNVNLQKKFNEAFSKFSENKIVELNYWNEIQKEYSKKNRHYHNLIHLESMITELTNIKCDINDWDSIIFSIFYHDYVYKSTSKNNEEKSAEIAKIRLENLNLSLTQIDKIVNQILATKFHEKSCDMDTNYLLDADLSILGKNWTEYHNYTKQIRNEYSIYPDFLYKAGRKKVLESFLTFDEIYKTDFFKQKYEKQARENIIREIQKL